MRRLVDLLRSRIAVKLTVTLVAFTAVILAVAGLYLGRALERFAVESLEARLAPAARLLEDDARPLFAAGATTGQRDTFVRRAARPTEARVTLIGRDGAVLADSEVPAADLSRLENHAGRPEVRAAFDDRVGHDLRQSATLGAPLLYVAVPVHAGGQVVGALRLAVPLAVVTASYRALDRVMLVGVLVALGVAVAIALFVAGRVTRPVVEMRAIAARMSDGDFSVRVPVRSPDEIGGLGRALNVMAARLRDKMDDAAQEQAKVAVILDGMVEGVIAVDGHEQILLMNERARAMFGVARGSGDRKPFLEVVRNADLHEIFRDSRALGARAGEGTPEAILTRELALTAPAPRGLAGDRTLQVNAVPLRLGGEGLGAVMVLHDVSELRRLERVRTEFVANVSHELRTPLTAIQGYLETLLGGALDERENARAFLEIVARHTERLGRLLADLTDLSNIELGRVTLHRAAVDIAEVVESVLAIMQPRAQARDVALTAALPPDLPAAHADHDRVAQILINLVDNAVKYTPEGGQVTVSARGASGRDVEVTVADTGIGIPAADLPRITERFYRVDRARSRELGGTGLGLAIVKHLVVAHGGELTIASEVGRGTTVRITLPRADVPRPSVP
ncbi:MAG: HAMP domain-containing protein [Candidatus Rokubacteria bacterium]|nr:HAMP domain-containing protein [Candidatus Rokubacteria bacterium]